MAPLIDGEALDGIHSELAFWLKRWSRYPLAYVIECVGDTPSHQQAAILNALAVHPFVAVRSGHGIGKTRLMGWVANWYMDTRWATPRQIRLIRQVGLIRQIGLIRLIRQIGQIGLIRLIRIRVDCGKLLCGVKYRHLTLVGRGGRNHGKTAPQWRLPEHGELSDRHHHLRRDLLVL
jgi:hypothetical protein